MKIVYIALLTMVTAGQVASAVPARPDAVNRGRRPAQPAPIAEEDEEIPSAQSKDADSELKEQKRIADNQRRAEIVNQFLAKRRTPATVVAAVSGLDITAPLESTIYSWGRSLNEQWHRLPFTGGDFYRGIQPHFVEFKNVDAAANKTGHLAKCFLDFHTSKKNPNRIFMRTRECSETELAYWTDKRGFLFAAVVQINNKGRVEQFRELTETDLLVSNVRLKRILEDSDVFQAPRSNAPSQPPADEPEPAEGNADS